jgi:nitrite reductase (NADH) small subunit
MSTSTSPASAITWHAICALNDIVPNTGVAALIGLRQIAVVRVITRDGGESLHALSNWDPIGKAMVMARGIVGTKGGTLKIASPLYKQSYDLRSGQCLDDPTVSVPVYPVRVSEGMIQVAL